MNALADRGFLIYDMIKINDELKALIPPLTTKEYETLEQSILKEGCRDALIVWNDILVDGHHRYSICQKHDLQFTVNDYEFDNFNAVKIWMILNAKGRRSLSEGWDFELSQTLKKLLIEEGKLNISANKGGTSSLSTMDKEAHNTRKEIADYLGWSETKVARADKVWKDADDETKDKIKSNDISFNKAYNNLKKKEKKQERQDKINKAKEKGKTAKIPHAIKLLEGDLFDVINNVDDNSVDLLITDPPYFMNKADWDSFADYEAFKKFTTDWLLAVLPKLKKDYNAFISFNSEYFFMLELICRELKLPIQSRLIWHYRNAGGKSAGKQMFSKTYEPILHFGNKALNFGEVWDDQRFDVWTIAVPQSNFLEGKYHPTQKPLTLFERLISLGSNENDLVLDCFAGSGTTGIGCKNTNRQCILIERESEYINTIKGRL